MENEETLDLELEQTETEVEQQIDEVEDTTDWKAEAAKWRRLAQKKPKSITKRESYDDEVVKDVQYLKTIEAKRQYGFENSLSPEETDFVFKFANGNPDKDALENPFVKSGLEGYRSAKRIADNTPSSSGSSPVFGNKSFSELSEEERKEAFEKRMGR